MLVAEAVGHLAHVVDSDIANSLLLSVVQQLAGDLDPAVRAAAAASLGMLVPALSGHDKYLLVCLACLPCACRWPDVHMLLPSAFCS